MADEGNGPKRGFGALGGMAAGVEEETKGRHTPPSPPPPPLPPPPFPPSAQSPAPQEIGPRPVMPRQPATGSPTLQGGAKVTPLRATAIGIGAWAGILVLVMILGSLGREQSTSNRTAPPAGATGPLQFEPVALPEALPLPASGVMYTYGSFGGPNRRLEAPFEIKAGQGSHFLVKLVHVGTNQPAMTIFVRSGETVEAEVPLGTFEVRYASGDTWYGDDLLFGPKTSYSKADTVFTFEIVGNQVQGFTITLYTVANGNLKTKEIGASEF